ncbi:MAG: TIR domain-containing protein [Dehalococcoidia bacterium]|jgi:hypothetical protein
MAKRKQRVFVSFDYENDKGLKELLIGQSRSTDSPFDVTDTSLKEEEPEKEWLEKARAKIKSSDTVVVMLGKKTHDAPGVLKEVKVTRELEKRIFQIKQKDLDCSPVENAGKVYNWTWDNLKALLPMIEY